MSSIQMSDRVNFLKLIFITCLRTFCDYIDKK